MKRDLEMASRLFVRVWLEWRGLWVERFVSGYDLTFTYRINRDRFHNGALSPSHSITSLHHYCGGSRVSERSAHHTPLHPSTTTVWIQGEWALSPSHSITSLHHYCVDPGWVSALPITLHYIPPPLLCGSRVSERSAHHTLLHPSTSTVWIQGEWALSPSHSITSECDGLSAHSPWIHTVVVEGCNGVWWAERFITSPYHYCVDPGWVSAQPITLHYIPPPLLCGSRVSERSAHHTPLHPSTTTVWIQGEWALSPSHSTTSPHHYCVDPGWVSALPITLHYISPPLLCGSRVSEHSAHHTPLHPSTSTVWIQGEWALSPSHSTTSLHHYCVDPGWVSAQPITLHYIPPPLLCGSRVSECSAHHTPLHLSTTTVWIQGEWALSPSHSTTSLHLYCVDPGWVSTQPITLHYIPPPLLCGSRVSEHSAHHTPSHPPTTTVWIHGEWALSPSHSITLHHIPPPLLCGSMVSECSAHHTPSHPSTTTVWIQGEWALSPSHSITSLHQYCVDPGWVSAQPITLHYIPPPLLCGSRVSEHSAHHTPSHPSTTTVWIQGEWALCPSHSITSLHHYCVDPGWVSTQPITLHYIPPPLLCGSRVSQCSAHHTPSHPSTTTVWIQGEWALSPSHSITSLHHYCVDPGWVSAQPITLHYIHSDTTVWIQGEWALSPSHSITSLHHYCVDPGWVSAQPITLHYIHSDTTVWIQGEWALSPSHSITSLHHYCVDPGWVSAQPITLHYIHSDTPWWIQ